MGGTSLNEKIRFAPSTHFHGTATIKFRVWDGSQGTATSSTTPSTFNTNTNGGTSAFSTGVISKTITVRPINDQPDIPGGFTNRSHNEDDGG